MVPSRPSGQAVLTVIAPCYNEAAGIDAFHRQVRDVLDRIPQTTGRIVFVDDGSTDGTLERLDAIAARDAAVEVYSLSRNFGHQVALSAGLDVARGDAVVMMDADLQHPPRLIPALVQEWRRGFDVVSAVRNTTSGASLFKRTTADAFYWFINRVSDIEIVPGAADFCLLSRRAHEALVAMPERHRFLRGMVSWIGFSRTLVPFDAPERTTGASSYTLLKMMGLAVDALLSFSAAPMRVASRMGALLAVPAFFYLLYVIGRYFVVGDLVPGWGSTVSVLLIVGGMQLVFIGLIGEYLSRIFEETKHRPLYVFKQRPVPAAGRDEGSWIAAPHAEELTHERLGDRFADALSPYDTARRVAVLIDEFLTDEMIVGRRVLDVGSGLGFFSERLVQRGAIVTACDIGPGLVEKTRTRARCDAVVADALRLTDAFGTNRFDAVVSSECIEHTPSPSEALAQMVAVVKPGGVVAVSTPNRLWQPVVRLASRLELRPFDGYEHFSTWSGMRRTLARAGADVIAERGLHLFPFQFGGHAFSTWCDRRLQAARPLMINVCVLARKRAAPEAAPPGRP